MNISEYSMRDKTIINIMIGLGFKFVRASMAIADEGHDELFFMFNDIPNNMKNATAYLTVNHRDTPTVYLAKAAEVIIKVGSYRKVDELKRILHLY